MTRHLKTLAYIFCAIIFSHSALAGAWVKDKGAGFLQVSYSTMSYNTLFGPDGFDIGLKRQVHDQTLQLYLEHGLGDSFMIIAVVPYKFIRTSESRLVVEDDQYPNVLNPAGKLSAFSNTYLTFRKLLHNSSFVVSTDLQLGFPTARYDLPEGLRSGYSAFMLAPYLNIGKGWSESYFSLKTGYQFRTNNLPDYYKGDVEAGYRFGIGKSSDLWFVGVLGVSVPLKNVDVIDEVNLQTGTYLENEGNVAIGGKFIFKTGKLMLSGSSAGVLWSQYGAQAAIINIGVAIEY